jgi:hypothetical protein
MNEDTLIQVRNYYTSLFDKEGLKTWKKDKRHYYACIISGLDLAIANIIKFEKEEVKNVTNIS